MGKSKSKSRRDRRLNNKNTKSTCRNIDINNKPTNFQNPLFDGMKLRDKYGIRQLIEQTMESKNDRRIFENPQTQDVPNCIDIGNDDVLCEEEVIDLTKTTANSINCDVNEPTMIDISEEERNSESEVCVIATYSKAPENPHSNKDRIGELIHTRDKIVLRCKSRKGKSKLKRKYRKMLRLGKVAQRQPVKSKSKENVGVIGSNISVNSPLPLPSSGLRPVIIDGNNVAFVHSNYHFSCKRLEICINYFKEKGHKVTAFVPQYRTSSKRNDDPKLLTKLEREGTVVFTPSKVIDGKKIVPYDDRFIVQTAVLKGGIIVSRDNYKDLLHENPAWAETIKYRTLAFTWVDDVLMFPEDPLGEFGPKLEEFLRFH